MKSNNNLKSSPSSGLINSSSVKSNIKSNSNLYSNTTPNELLNSNKKPSSISRNTSSLKSSPNKKKYSSTKKSLKNKRALSIFPSISYQEIQKNLISTLTKTPELVFKDSKSQHKPKDFKKYIQLVDNNMTKYQINFIAKGLIDKEEISKGPNERFMGKNDKKLIKKMYDLNRTMFNSELNSKNEDYQLKINIQSRDYPNPYQSLGVIKHNYQIFNQMSKDFIFRQTDLFKQQYKYVQKNLDKIRSTNPNLHVSGASGKEKFEIPLVDLTDERGKVGGGGNLPVLPHNNATNLRLFSYYRYPNKNFPEGREQFSICSKDNTIIISGGLSSNMRTMTIWSLNLEQLEWNKIEQKTICNNRYGHTSTLYQNKIYLFGGKTKYGTGFSSVGLEVFNLIDGSYPDIEPEGNVFPQPRRSHIAELIGQQILIYGGINDENEILNDCYLLSLYPLKWSIGSISRVTPAPRLYGHTSCLVLPKEYQNNSKFNIYSYPQVELGNTRLKEKGVFIFGGKSKEEGGLSNKMWILLLGQKPLRFILPETKGKSPSPRYFHSMSYYEKGNFLIVHGGRNDQMSETSALNDTFVFDLENFEWMEVELYSKTENYKVLSRCGHQSVTYMNKLIILGGMNNTNYLGSTLFIVNLDFGYSSTQKSAEELMIRDLESKSDYESKKKLNKLKNELRKNNQLGVITSFELPNIK